MDAAEPDDLGIERDLSDDRLRRYIDIASTVTLDVVLLLVAYYCLGLGLHDLDLHDDCLDEYTCSPLMESQFELASTVLIGGVVGAFILAIVLSVIFLVLRKLAFYIPIVAGIVMIGSLWTAFAIVGLPPSGWEASMGMVPAVLS